MVGLGCNSLGVTVAPDDVPALIHAALDCGITLFDTADIYGSYPGQSEELLGQALGSRRDDVVVATKFGMDMGGANGPDWGVRGSRRYLRRAVEASLRRLNTDHIDLYQIHAFDDVTPLAETIEAMSELVVEGKVRYLGSSNFTAWQVTDADWIARTGGHSRFISAQNPYSLLDRTAERELIPALAHLGTGLLPYYPLASGLLTGKYERGVRAPSNSRLANRPGRLDAANFDVIDAIRSFALEQGVAMSTVAIGFLAAQEVVGSVICGASRPEQIHANVEALTWQPTPADLATLTSLAT